VKGKKIKPQDSLARVETQRPDKVVSYLNFKNGAARQSGQSRKTKAEQSYLAGQLFSAVVVL
jgi:hypothetical protein